MTYTHADYLAAPFLEAERDERIANMREAAEDARFADLLADDDSIYDAWSCEDEVATAVCPLAALRETDPAKRAAMGLAFLEGMTTACRERLRKKARDGSDYAEPQTELVKAARFALFCLDGPVGMVTPGAERRLRKALHSFQWVSA